eukprot:CAMPEP_0168394442 /NCGR_PEP_ID=MMETSP0228-20121227/19536_1 /TAXON_ID=133427 /ORGANISM="Protoceratium reticulatum, Strain CCCM 535 (=CCMP 1889)" /LENGTH=64 /DNA_ID=CAMNT_0008407855 /DNA_START=49 /DNA_END=240 /DNA_ORIENTATION=-
MQALAHRAGHRQSRPVRGQVKFTTGQVALPPRWRWWQAVRRPWGPARLTARPGRGMSPHGLPGP